ncbi:MoaD/ThiS family protein [Halonatronum saccharophilum]|uniref:MoaD/ThiS family protein n=1 Tax=Halonatronum saccharophilum TaxID=150060 RepID=UPI0004857ADF|nr:MoaD/ThiS family protein [Halonatronum saccharophilum]
MEVEVRLFATLRSILAKEDRGVGIVDIEEGSSVDDLIEYLEIPRDIPLIIMINGQRKSEESLLKEGDRVGIFPPVGGG